MSTNNEEWPLPPGMQWSQESMDTRSISAGAGPWRLSSSSDPLALAVVDGLGAFAEHGPHYSRRTPGSKTFTGCGQEIVLLTTCGRAVWAVVRQKTPHAKGSAGKGQGRWVWRNMLFRNLGAGLSSDLIESATAETYRQWERRYGTLPSERLRTEVKPKAVRSPNPGACYQIAGWERGERRRGKVFFYAPPHRSHHQSLEALP